MFLLYLFNTDLIVGCAFMIVLFVSIRYETQLKFSFEFFLGGGAGGEGLA